MTDSMVRGSCLCGSVRFRMRRPLSFMTHCHCTMCRKSHAAPFATYVAAPAEGFELEGEEHVVRFQSSENTVRAFCGRCGSVVPTPPTGKRAFLAAGCLDDDPGVRAELHLFVGSKAPWFEIADTLPQHEAFPPGWDLPVVARPTATASEPGWTAGGCLCERVAYEVQDGPCTAYHCHCSRCRKARAAAHTTNMPLPVARFRWLRGEDELSSFKVPDAERFSQAFCPTCGSGMPLVREDRVIIPVATLDGDPGIEEQFHIFVGSKAPWYEIADALPQYEQYRR